MNTDNPIKMIPKETVKAVWCQIKLGHPIQAFFTEKYGLGIFRLSSHIQHESGQPKVRYNHLESAQRAAVAMHEKTGKTYRAYKCAYCKGFHIGKPTQYKKKKRRR